MMRTAEYLPAVVAVFVSAIIGALVSAFAGRFGPKRSVSLTASKGQSFEGGSPSVGEAHSPLALRLYPVLLAFLVFDVAVALLVPWALLVGQSTSSVCMPDQLCVDRVALWQGGAGFGVVLLVAWVHVRRTRAAEWNA